jgi:hypothetical protein
MVEIIKRVFYVQSMPATSRDRLIIAQIAGVTRRHARGRALTGAEEAAALAELAEVAEARVDLLAEEAGVTLGFHEHDPGSTEHLQVAQLCIKAGADPALISRWIEVGRQRAAAAEKTPFTA